MKQIEITVRLKENIESAIKKLENNGFKMIRESDINDKYMCNLNCKIGRKNIQEFLKHSVLLRSLKFDGKEIKKITYKNKEIDNKGDIISEQKVNLDCNDLNKAQFLFECLGFNELIEVRYHVIVYEKNGTEFAFQIVENLGTLIEYENLNDFTNKTLDEINKAKKEMLEEIENHNLNITNEIDVKKAFELICKKYKLE